MKTKQDLAQKNNIIRAAVMGANDGILSVSGIVIGVAGATTSSFAIFIAGFAGALAGTVSMAMGEYVSVHSENDAQKKAIIQQKSALQDRYQEEFNFVKERYMPRLN
jgi:VIT1/CCC1 family predicted Fe2+/Mn2+ transporter